MEESNARADKDDKGTDVIVQSDSLSIDDESIHAATLFEPRKRLVQLTEADAGFTLKASFSIFE